MKYVLTLLAVAVLWMVAPSSAVACDPAYTNCAAVAHHNNQYRQHYQRFQHQAVWSRHLGRYVRGGYGGYGSGYGGYGYGSGCGGYGGCGHTRQYQSWGIYGSIGGGYGNRGGYGNHGSNGTIGFRYEGGRSR